ncbi:MAG: U32 family peptidase [Spirochaetes bacterium]|nr:U32 family peptidase [Spirochaetota bacterium]
MIKPELILPAGNREKASYALAYGADAVYAGLPCLSLRTKYISFDELSLGQAIDEAHSLGKRFYVACNLFAHEGDLNRVVRFLDVMEGYKPDALIVSDPGIIRIIRKRKINIPLHLSTQANTTNSQALHFWREEGVERVILARELRYEELERMCQESGGVELEIFIHGAMCVSYSGRCLLSNFLTGRDANRGACAGTCRWRYALVEETREDERFEIEEDARGSYILNSKDLCLLRRVPELKNFPIHGYKVEGRTKNLLYVALIARAYRRVIDDVFIDGSSGIDPEVVRLIGLTDSHGFTEGFLFPDSEPMQNYDRGAERSQQVLGFIRECADREIRISVKNPLSVGDEAIAISPEAVLPITIVELRMHGESIDRAYGAMGHEVRALIDKNLTGPHWRYGMLVKG